MIISHLFIKINVKKLDNCLKVRHNTYINKYLWILCSNEHDPTGKIKHLQGNHARIYSFVY